MPRDDPNHDSDQDAVDQAQCLSSHSTVKDPEETLTCHSALWFSDGSLVLRAEQTLFKVHISQLSRHSKFFQSLFTLPQPTNTTPSQDIPRHYVPDGCIALRIYDPADEVANLLHAVYDGPSFRNNDRDDFRVQAGILRLATKYDIPKLRQKCINHLSMAWPPNLQGWDAREEVARAFEMETGTRRRLRYPSPITVINLAWQVGAQELLPAAFYELSRYHFSEIFGAGRDEALGDGERLSPDDMERLALGKEAALASIPPLIKSMGTHNQRETNSNNPCQPARTLHQRKVLGSVCLTAAACRDDLAELVELATQHYLFDRGKGCADPLYVAEELGQLKSIEVSDCRACARSLERWAARERERMWKLIPSWFHLAPNAS